MDDTSFYGIDWSAALSTDDNDEVEMVEVPAITNPLTSSDFSELCSLIDPTSDSDSHGIDF